MATTSLLLFIILIAALVAIALLVVLLLRKPEAAFEAQRLRLEEALRDEQRSGRGRTAAAAR